MIRPFIRALSLVLIFGLTVLAQNKRPMTPEDVVGLNRASDAQIALDGRRIAFVVTSWDRESDRFNSDIWMVNDSRETVRLTSNPKRDDHPRWSPDLRRIAFLSERGAEGGAQIYMLNLHGGEPMQLSFHKAPVTDFEWSPDGRYIAFIADEAREKPKTKPPIVADEDNARAQIWLIEVATGQIKQLTKGCLHVSELSWAWNSQQIVFTARSSSKLIDNPTTEVFTIPVNWRAETIDSATAKPLTKGNGAESDPQFSPDGRWVSYLAHADGDQNTGPDRIHIVPANGGDARVLANSFDGYVRGHRWIFDSQRVVFIAGLGLNQQIYTMNINDQQPVAMTRSEGINTSFSVTMDGMNIAFVHENPRVPSEIALLAARIMVPVFLTQLNPQANDFALGQVETVKWKSYDGTDVEGVLIFPIGYQTGKRVPLLTYIHGGPEGAYTKSFNATWSAFPQIYAAKGFAVFMPNFRGSSNYGAKFAQSNAKLVGKVDYEDIMSGIDHLIKTEVADENRLAVAGWSYGGYMSGWIIGHTNRFKCAAYGAGLSNAVSYWGTADIIAQRERLHGGTPWEARKMFDEQSPLSYLTNAKTPTLIFHGEKDERVPLGQSLESYRTLKRLGTTTQLVIYPDQGHGLQLPGYQLDKIKRELAWIEKYVPAK